MRKWCANKRQSAPNTNRYAANCAGKSTSGTYARSAAGMRLSEGTWCAITIATATQSRTATSIPRNAENTSSIPKTGSGSGASGQGRGADGVGNCSLGVDTGYGCDCSKRCCFGRSASHRLGAARKHPWGGKAERPGPTARSVRCVAEELRWSYAPAFFTILAQESLSGRVRLKTKRPGLESGSTQK